MALKQCPECKGEVSDKATRCPHCGFQHPRTATKAIFGVFLIIAALILSVLLAAALGQF